MKERLRASDYRFILICAALLAATTWFSVRNFYRAFPEASIDFKVSRDDARTSPRRFLSDQGYRLEDYRQAAQFTFDEQAKTFLERELGLERANRIMGYARPPLALGLPLVPPAPEGRVQRRDHAARPTGGLRT